jgi:hypothetical protein
MSEISEIRPFKQVPSCDPETLLTITAAEYLSIQNILNSFKPSLSALDNIFKRGMDEGKIVIKYIQEDGTEITKEEAFKYLEAAKEFLKEKEA